MLRHGSDLILKSLAHMCEAFLCPGMDGMSQRAMDGGATNVHGSTVFLKDPWKAVRSLQFT